MPINPTRYDEALICENGHVINSMHATMPEHSTRYCEVCGREGLSKCRNCEQPIRGYWHGGVIGMGYTKPAHCGMCGTPYPWTEQALEAGREILDDLEDLDPAERERLKRALDDVSREGPKTEAAAGRLRRFADKVSGPVGQALLKAAADVGTEAARKILLGGP